MASRYDRVAGRMMRRPFRRIAADLVAGLPAGATVLDVGTGPGRLPAEILRQRPDLLVLAVDPAPDMVDLTRERLAAFGDRGTALVGDAESLPVDACSVDLVVSTLSVHHWADLTAAGAELVRVLRDGGQVRIYDLRSSPFRELAAAVTGDPDDVAPTRFRITPLPRPTLFRMVLRPLGRPGG